MIGRSCLIALCAVSCFSTLGFAFENSNGPRAEDTRNIIYVSDQRLSQARDFVQKVTDRGIDFLANPELSYEQRKKEFSGLLKDNFDIKTIARFSLGRYWRVATKQEKKEYLELFENMILEVYSKRFGDYQGENLEVESARASGKSDYIVTTKIILKDGTPVQVDWRVRDRSKGFQVIDIIVEGVSMAVTQRSDFASVIQRGGGKVNVLLAHLKQ